MAAEQPKRRGTNWHEARDYWLALQPPRSFQTVANQYRVSRSRVRYVAVREGWEALAAEVDRRALEQATRRIVLSRADRVTKVLGIVDGALAHFDAELEAKAADAKLADLPGLVKLAELLVGEATERMEFAEVQEALGSVMAIAVELLPVARRAEFLSRVREQLGSVRES